MREQQSRLTPPYTKASRVGRHPFGLGRGPLEGSCRQLVDVVWLVGGECPSGNHCEVCVRGLRGWEVSGGEGAEGHMPAADGSGIMMHRGGGNWTEGASERGALTRRPGDDDAMPSATMDPARCHAGCEN